MVSKLHHCWVVFIQIPPDGPSDCIGPLLTGRTHCQLDLAEVIGVALHIRCWIISNRWS